MSYHIQITRHLYEEAHHLNLVLLAGNGLASGGLEFYLTPDCVLEIGKALCEFPSHKRSVYLFERGSERHEDRRAWYFRLRAYALDDMDKVAIQLRLNNNQFHFPKGRNETPLLTDFVIKTDNANLKELGNLIVKFSELNHQRLYWGSSISQIDNELKFKGHCTESPIDAALASLP